MIQIWSEEKNNQAFLQKLRTSRALVDPKQFKEEVHVERQLNYRKISDRQQFKIVFVSEFIKFDCLQMKPAEMLCLKVVQHKQGSGSALDHLCIRQRRCDDKCCGVKKEEAPQFQEYNLHHITPRSENSQNHHIVRAEYKECINCPPIILQCRVLDGQSPLSYTSSQKIDGASEKSRVYPLNEGKNVAKNFGKAIIAFIAKNKKLLREVCRDSASSFNRITEDLHKLKKTLKSVAGFRRVWSDYKYAACMRRVSNLFLRQYGLSYIFNSKINNTLSHIKFRRKFLQALQDPSKFDRLKDY